MRNFLLALAIIATLVASVTVGQWSPRGRLLVNYSDIELVSETVPEAMCMPSEAEFTGVVQIVLLKPDRRIYHRGSGFTVAPGYLATAKHVVEHFTTNPENGVGAIMVNGAIRPLRAIHLHPEADIAILEVDTVGLHVFPLATAKPYFFQTVLAMGFPASMPRTVTKGHVQAIENIFHEGQVLFSTAHLHRGMSGGPVMTCDGEVVGLSIAVPTYSIDGTGQPGPRGAHGSMAALIHFMGVAELAPEVQRALDSVRDGG